MRRTLVPLGALLALLALLAPPHAAAQQAATLVVQLDGRGDEPLTPDAPIQVVDGVVRFTADVTAYAGIIGIPVSYAVTKQPEWATVVVTPASDLFEAHAPPLGLAYTVVKPIQVVVILAPNATGEDVGQVEVTATTMAAQGGKSVTGKGAFVVEMSAPDPCDAESAFAVQSAAAVTPVEAWAPAGAAAFVAGLVASVSAGRRQKR